MTLSNLASPPSQRAIAADLLFSALKGVHGLANSDAELLARAEAGLRLIQSTARFSAIEHHLFSAALADVDDGDRYVVEAAASYAADLAGAASAVAGRRIGIAEKRRALWLGALLRVSDAVCAQGAVAPDDIYAAWTDDVLYIEFDGKTPSESQVERVRARVAALCAISGRQVVLANSTARRGAA
jgi:hypothetical protein